MSAQYVVPDGWMDVASEAAHKAWVGGANAVEMRHAALAAVAPMIAAAERERCAKVAETHEWFVGGIGTKAPGSGQSKAIAAAIRALKDTP